MRQALIQPDRQTAVVRNYKAFGDDTAFKRGGTRKTQREIDEDTTEFLWQNTPHVSDGRVALWVEDTDDPRLTTDAEKAAMLSEEEAIADGFYIPNPFAPTNTGPPELTYTSAWVGLAVSCVSGEWTGEPTFKYQWQADGTDLIQAVTSVHTVTVADVGKVLTCVVTAANEYGSASAKSNECTVVTTRTAGARAAPPAVPKRAAKKIAKKAPRNRAEIARKPANTRTKAMVAKKKKKPVLFTKEAAKAAVKKITPQRRKKK